jgi:WD40 repeat protein
MALINPNGTVSIEAVKAGGPTRTLGSPVPPAPRPYEGSVCWSPDGKYLAAGGVDRKVTIWNAATGEKIRELAQPPGKGGEVFGVVWSPDGKHLACGARGGILQIWDLK